MSTQTQILTHYLRMACTEAGVSWSWENDQELGEIEDEIRRIVRAETAAELAELRERLSRLERIDLPPA